MTREFKSLMRTVCDADQNTVKLTPDRKIFTLADMEYTYSLNFDYIDKED